MATWFLATGSEEALGGALNTAQLMNLMTERQPKDARTPAPLMLAPGLQAWATCGAGPIRGCWAMNDTLYVVSGTALYSINSLSAAVTQVGAAGSIPGTGLVSMADNGTQLCIVLQADGGAGYIYTTAGGVVQITSANYFASFGVLFFDGYFLFIRQFSTEVFFSALYDGTSFNGLDFFNTESTSGQLQAIATQLQLVFLFKSDCIEMWYDAGANDNPFQRYAGGVINIGCVSGMSITRIDNAIFFLGSDNVVYRLQANAPIRVSTHAMEQAISGEIFPGQISSFAYTVNGHKHVVFNLPYQQRTIVFDISTGQWHERMSFGAGGNALGWWRCNCAFDADTISWGIGDRYTGQIWRPSMTAYTEGAFPLYAWVISAPLAKDGKYLTVNKFEIKMQSGVQTGGAPNPAATLSTSKDDGASYTNRGSRPIPLNAALDQNMRWLALGRAKQWSFQITLNDPVQRLLVGCWLDVEEES